MAADPNMGLQRRRAASAFCDRHMVSFQPDTVGSATTTIPSCTAGFSGVNSATGITFSSSPDGTNDTAVLFPRGNAARRLHLHPVIGLKHGKGLAADWLFEEQLLLEEGLVKYANEPTIMRYIKIGAILHNKTVRDVAMRCRWMIARKRRKQEEYYQKRMKDNKVISFPSLFLSQVIDASIQRLVQENTQLLVEITANISSQRSHSPPASSQLQDNIDIFLHVKNNIECILNWMSGMPGVMAQMPSLPISVDELLLAAATSPALSSGSYLSPRRIAATAAGERLEPRAGGGSSATGGGGRQDLRRRLRRQLGRRHLGRGRR
ncbi:unnamed protein product [Spirodela intermedia]|uniref:Uncharacterized protein n=1 Tax=Spirodela intermedia TaxID=51605 RepID=A0A7I8JB11_SPIIN|nr:unnamed protein product [Spirodela intermedia]CAA6666633.1 unnamed protein product [Spirodela intermedia]